MVTEEQVFNVLRKVVDPELHRDVVSLGMIKDLKIEGSKVSFRFVLTTPACPIRSQMETMGKQAVLAIPGVTEVDIKMDANVTSAFGPKGADLIPGVRNTIAVGSGKGGVGKSTVSVNVAVALAAMGARVGLLDADITGPDIPLMMGADGSPKLDRERHKIIPLESHGIKLISIGFFMDEKTPAIWRGPMIAQALRQFFGDVDWGELDYLVIDLPPGTGDAALSVAQLVPLSGGLIVTTSQDVSLLDVKKQIAMFKKVNVPIIGVVENMSYFVCPHCGETTDIFGQGGGEKVAKEMDVPFLGSILFDPRIRIGGDTGMPIMKSHPDSPVTETFRQIASTIAGRISVINLQSQMAIPLISIR